MNDPQGRSSAVWASGVRNFTGLQFIVFAGVGVVGLAALLAAGLAVGMAVAGAAVMAVAVLAAWFIVANLAGGGRALRRAERRD